MAFVNNPEFVPAYPEEDRDLSIGLDEEGGPPADETLKDLGSGMLLDSAGAAVLARERLGMFIIDMGLLRFWRSFAGAEDGNVESVREVWDWRKGATF